MQNGRRLFLGGFVVGLLQQVSKTWNSRRRTDSSSVHWSQCYCILCSCGIPGCRVESEEFLHSRRCWQHRHAHWNCASCFGEYHALSEEDDLQAYIFSGSRKLEDARPFSLVRSWKLPPWVVSQPASDGVSIILKIVRRQVGQLLLSYWPSSSVSVLGRFMDLPLPPGPADMFHRVCSMP